MPQAPALPGIVPAGDWKENYKTSQDIGKTLFEQIKAQDIDYVVTDCETCKWQIEMSTTKKGEHPVSILAARQLCAISSKTR